MGHGDDLRRLSTKFDLKNRWSNFGAALHSMEVHGFRGVDELRLTFDSPITALSGLNGTGKSTLAQLAVCAYRPPAGGGFRRYYVKDYFPVSALDPEPFGANARAIYAYSVEGDHDLQQVTVSRATTEWSGYKRQPKRACYYIGFTSFIPKVERRDFSVYSGRLLQVGAARELSPAVTSKITGIIGLPYDRVGFTRVTASSRSAELATAARNGQQYSENHMGLGEGRVFYMVNAMETAPPRSLFILEEPETSLHGEAQERLARYFVDVSARLGHQIILTTHSAAVLGQLGTESIAYLRRRADDSKVEVTPGLATYQIDAYLRGERAPGSRVICTEDAFARQLLCAILRRCDRDLLVGNRFVKAGGHEQVRQAVRVLREGGLKAVGLTDGDTADAGRNGVFALPGGDAPERVVFFDDAVRSHFAGVHDLSVAEALAAETDHHRYAEVIGAKLALDEAVVATNACDAYVASRPQAEFDGLVNFVKSELS